MCCRSPDRGTAVETAVRDIWNILHVVDSPESLAVFKRLSDVTEKLASFSDGEILEAIRTEKSGPGGERPVKQVELEALLAVPEGFGDDMPVDLNFHARRLPDRAWRHSEQCNGIDVVIQVHRLREILSLIGFTRFEAVTPDIDGEYDTDVVRAQIALEPQWFPAVENRGEGVFLQLRADAVATWLRQPAVQQRLEGLATGHQRWKDDRKTTRLFPGGPYVLLHHALTPAYPVARDALRLSGELHPGSASTRTRRRNASASSSTPGALMRRGPWGG